MAEKVRKIEEMSEVEEPGQIPEKTGQRKREENINKKTRPVQLNRTGRFA